MREKFFLTQTRRALGASKQIMKMSKSFTGAALVALLIPIHLIYGAQPQSSAQQQAPAQQQPAAQTESLDSLRSRITAHITQPRFGPAAWGVKVVSLETGKVIADHNSHKYFNPASNAKLYSGALALDRLSGDYRIKTSLYSTARPDAAGALKADLLIYGRGDPSFAARLNGGDYFKSLDPLITSLMNAGVRRIEGDLIGDESYFQGPPLGSGWEWDDLQWYYGAEVSALSINDNALDLFVKPAERAGIPCRVSTGPPTPFVTIINRTQTVPKGAESRVRVYRPVGENIIYISGSLAVGSNGYSGYVAVHNPAGLFVNLFKEALARRGITVTGRVRTIDWKYREVTPLDFAKLIELGAVDSPPLKDLVREMMKPSQNLWAQMLLLAVGVNQKTEISSLKVEGSNGSARDSVLDKTSEQFGIDAMKIFLAQVGVRAGEVLLEEGSGLSRRDLVTPAATVELLSFMSRHRWADAFRDSLPIAGIDGTLQNRMKGTAAATNVRAKTGSLSYVYTLSGYVTTAAGERLAFSVMLNNYYNSDRAISPRDDLDAIPIMLANFSGRSQ
jgi:D-alanyl-D-alanine carboxypeptidase/D-alanyl-D-alanine-endopeptidase (penicillin-binding protein 4)